MTNTVQIVETGVSSGTLIGIVIACTVIGGVIGAGTVYYYVVKAINACL